MNDLVNHPAHYTGHESGVECIEITERMLSPNLANAFKYLFRAGLKGDVAVTHEQDLRKARFYVLRQIALLRSGEGSDNPGVKFRNVENDPVFRFLLDADDLEERGIGYLCNSLILIDEKLKALEVSDV